MQIVRWGQNRKHFLPHSLTVIYGGAGMKNRMQSFYAALLGSKAKSYSFLAAILSCLYTVYSSNSTWKLGKKIFSIKRVT
jgi:hypothetical protein